MTASPDVALETEPVTARTPADDTAETGVTTVGPRPALLPGALDELPPTPVGDRVHAPGPSREIPEATVARLPIYLRALMTLADAGTTTCSSGDLAMATGVNSAKLRKDLSYLGSYGTRGVGYDVDYLRYQIAREIGVTQDWPVIIVGIGNLGHALANYSGFRSRGFRVVALLDADPARHGSRVGGVAVRAFDDLEAIVADQPVSIGVIAVPAESAQGVADRLVGAGVSSILNFAPVVLAVPDGVDVRKVDLSIELQILAFHEQRKAVLDLTAALPSLPATGTAR